MAIDRDHRATAIARRSLRDSRPLAGRAGRSLAIGTVLVSAAFAVSACSTSPEASSSTESSSEPTVVTSSPPPQSSEAPAPVETPEQPAEPASLARKTYTKTIKGEGGYSQTITITIGPVIPSSRAALVQSDWAAVGGVGTNPCTDVNPQNDGVTNYVIKSEFAGFAFGTVTVTNDVPGFSAASFNYQGDRRDSSAMGLQFSNGSECDGLYGGFRFQPSWTSETWGPVPLVVAIDNYRSPDHADGDPSMLTNNPVSFFEDLKIPLVPLPK